MFVALVLLLNLGTGYAFENFDQAFNQMRHRYSLGHYKRLVAIVPEALELSRTPEQQYQVWYYKGLALEGLLKFWEAAQVFEKAAGIENISPQHRLQARYNQIRSQYAAQCFAAALTGAEKYAGAAVKPTVLQLNILLIGIEAANQLNRSATALELAGKMAQGAVPGSAWHYRGVILELQTLCLMKNYPEAERLINQVRPEQVPRPMQSEFLAWSGFCYEKADKPKLAGKCYARAYDNYSTYYSGLAALRHANLLDRTTRDYRQALSRYRKVLELAAANSWHKSQAIYKIAAIYNREHQPENALKAIAQLDELKAPSVYWKAKIYNLHGDILYKKGETGQARKYFQACLNLAADLPDSRLYASEIIAQIDKKTTLPEKK